MDRQIIYPGQLLPETTLLQMTKDSMIGAAKLASALLGTSTMASGFAVTPTGPASLQVLCAPGEIYSLTTIDALAFSTLPADTTHTILKQGILLDGVTLSCPAPGTTGQSINYLVQVTYQDADATPVLLPYYNSANPALPYSGMGNNGLTQNTVRKGAAVVAVKAGASATTGSQVTPAPDAGYVGLYVVTVAFGQTTITAGSIAALASAPLINSTLHGLAPIFNTSLSVGAATAAGHAMQLGQATGRLMGLPQVFLASGTYTPTPGMTSVIFRVQGGGGAGAGLATPSAGNISLGAPGCSGSYAEGRFLAAAIGASQVVTVGAAGAAASNTAGGAGGTSSVGSLITAPGGPGGGLLNNQIPGASNGNGGLAGTPTGANIFQSIGTCPGLCTSLSASSAQSGAGGGSIFGNGGTPPIINGAGVAAQNYGAGGSGVVAGSGGANQAGGAGKIGIVIAYEYF